MTTDEFTGKNPFPRTRFTKQALREWIASAVFFLAFCSPFMWATFFATKEQRLSFALLLAGTLLLIPGKLGWQHYWSGPLGNIITRNVYGLLGRLYLEESNPPYKPPLGEFGEKHPRTALALFLLGYWAFCALYMRLVCKGTKHEIDGCLGVLLVLHLIIRPWERATKDQSQPSAR